MRYANTLPTKLALFDLPIIKYGQHKQSFSHKIFKHLLILDTLEDDDCTKVVEEAVYELGREDISFEEPFLQSFGHYLGISKYLARWRKMRQDHNHYIQHEIRRRNSENPYYNPTPDNFKSWDMLPDFSRQKLNQPWQFDALFKEIQRISGGVFELAKAYENQKDKDVFRIKVNGMLAPAKIIFALDSAENVYNFTEHELSIVNIKLGLDAYKAAYIFIQRVMESLHKLSWAGKSPMAKAAEEWIASAADFSEKLKRRIEEMERRFMLFLEYDSDEYVES